MKENKIYYSTRNHETRFLDLNELPKNYLDELKEKNAKIARMMRFAEKQRRQERSEEMANGICPICHCLKPSTKICPNCD